MTSITLGTRVCLTGSLIVFLSKVVGLVLDGPVGVTLEELNVVCSGLGRRVIARFVVGYGLRAIPLWSWSYP